jgi:hypothetical protein
VLHCHPARRQVKMFRNCVARPFIGTAGPYLYFTGELSPLPLHDS